MANIKGCPRKIMLIDYSISFNFFQIFMIVNDHNGSQKNVFK